MIILVMLHVYIQRKKLEINDTIDAPKWANYLDFRLEDDEDGTLYILYDKRDDFDFSIVNFPYLNINIPKSRAYDILEFVRHFLVQMIYSGFKVLSQ